MPEQSTAIDRVKYKETHGKLFVKFSSGAEVVHVGVPGEVHRSFMAADSRDGYYAAEISDRYPYNRLED